MVIAMSCYNRNVILILLFILVFVPEVKAQTYVTRATDNAGNYTTWASGNNLGSGFNAWVFTNTGTGGQFLGSAYATSIDVSSKSFGVYGNPAGANVGKAKRTFSSLKENEKLTFKMSTRFRNGNKGVDILSGSTVLFNINIGGDQYTYENKSGGGAIALSIAYFQDLALTITLIKKTGNSIYVKIEPNNGPTALESEFTLSSSTIDGLEFYVAGTDAGSDNNLYFNSLEISQPKYVTVADGDWNTPGTWGSSIPGANSIIEINHSVTVNSAVTGNTLSLTINSGKSLTFGADGSLPVQGNWTNNGTLDMTAGGTISFGGSSTITVSGTNMFNNVNLGCGVNFGTSSTVNGTLALNAGGFVSVNAPTYGASSTLQYNNDYQLATEWYANVASGQGVPQNVVVNGGNVYYAIVANVYRQLNGNLTINSGKAFSLSQTPGGDLKVKGNLVNSGTLHANGRSVEFLGGTTQEISGAGTFNFSYLNVTNNSSISLLANIGVGNNINVYTGSSFDCGSSTITFSSGSTITGGAPLTTGTGTLVFSGTGTVNNSTTTFNNVTIAGGVNLGAGVTVNGTLQINAGGFLQTNYPIYGPSSTLKYNSGTTYGRGLEWSSTSGAGYPNNVQISGNTTLNLGANSGTGTARQIAGSLTIDAGSTFQMAGTNPMTKELTVLKNVSNAGTIILSTSVGGDLYIGGDLANTGTYTHNNRLTSLNGSTTQTITGTVNFGYLTVNDASLTGNISVANLLSINASKTLNCNDRTITINGGGALNNSGTFTAGTGKVVFGSGGVSTVSGTVTFNNVDLNGGVDFGTGSTINGTLQILSGGYVQTNAATYAANSTLKYASGGTYDRYTEWLATSGRGKPFNVILTNNTTVNLAANSGTTEARTIDGSLTIDAGSALKMQAPDNTGMTNTLTIGVDLVNNGTLTLSTAAGGDLIVTGTFSQNGTLDCKDRTVSGSTFVLGSGATLKTGSATGVNGSILSTTKSFNSGANYEFNGLVAQVTGTDMPATVNKLIVNNSNGVTLSQTTTSSTELGLTTGKLSVGSNTLTIGSAATVTGTPSASAMIDASGNGKVRKLFTADGTFTYPIGDESNYTPATLVFSGASTFGGGAYAEVTLKAEKHPANNSTNDYLNRYWNVNLIGITDYTCEATFKYVDGDVIGTESALVPGLKPVAPLAEGWYQRGTINTTANTFTVSFTNNTAFDGNTALSSADFTCGEATALPVELTSFTANLRNGMVDLKWETATEVNNHGFEIERMSATSSWNKIGFVEGHGSSNSPKYYSFSDKPVGSGKFSYRLKQIDNDGHFEYSPVVEVMVDNLPDGYVLEQNYPNPFNPETSIRFALKEDTKALLKIFNAMGEEVITLFDGIAEAGRYYDLRFDGTNLSSGFYIYKLVAGEHVSVKKMVLMK